MFNDSESERNWNSLPKLGKTQLTNMNEFKCRVISTDSELSEAESKIYPGRRSKVAQMLPFGDNELTRLHVHMIKESFNFHGNTDPVHVEIISALKHNVYVIIFNKLQCIFYTGRYRIFKIIQNYRILIISWHEYQPSKSLFQYLF